MSSPKGALAGQKVINSVLHAVSVRISFNLA